MPELTPQERLHKALSAMQYDDALHFFDTPTPNDPIALSPYHIEYLTLEQGNVHYRLYHTNALVGIADVIRTRDNRGLEWTRKQLSEYLVTLGLGDMRTHVAPMGIITPIDSPTSRLPRLPIERTIPDDFMVTKGVTKTDKSANYW